MCRPDPWPDFLAKYAQFEALNDHSILEKYNWRGKRRLTRRPSRGGQPGNANALKHGYYSRERLAAWAMLLAFLRAMDADERAQAAKKRPRSARCERL